MAEEQRNKAEERALEKALKDLSRSALMPEPPASLSWHQVHLVGTDNKSVHFSFGGNIDADLYDYYAQIHDSLIDMGLDIGQNGRFPISDRPLLSRGETGLSGAILSFNVDANGGHKALREKIEAAVEASVEAGNELRPKTGLIEKTLKRAAVRADMRALKSAAEDFVDAVYSPGEFDGVTGIKIKGPYAGPHLYTEVETMRTKGGSEQGQALNAALAEAGIKGGHDIRVAENGGIEALVEKFREGAAAIRADKEPPVSTVKGVKAKAKAEEKALVAALRRFEESDLFPDLPEEVRYGKASLLGRNNESIHFNHYAARGDEDKMTEHYLALEQALMDAGLDVGQNDRYSRVGVKPLYSSMSGGGSGSILSVDVKKNGGFVEMAETINAAVDRAQGSTKFQDRLAAESGQSSSRQR